MPRSIVGAIEIVVAALLLIAIHSPKTDAKADPEEKELLARARIANRAQRELIHTLHAKMRIVTPSRIERRVEWWQIGNDFKWSSVAEPPDELRKQAQATKKDAPDPTLTIGSVVNGHFTRYIETRRGATGKSMTGLIGEFKPSDTAMTDIWLMTGFQIRQSPNAEVSEFLGHDQWITKVEQTEEQSDECVAITVSNSESLHAVIVLSRAHAYAVKKLTVWLGPKMASTTPAYILRIQDFHQPQIGVHFPKKITRELYSKGLSEQPIETNYIYIDSVIINPPIKLQLSLELPKDTKVADRSSNVVFKIGDNGKPSPGYPTRPILTNPVQTSRPPSQGIPSPNSQFGRYAIYGAVLALILGSYGAWRARSIFRRLMSKRR
jgi:hypothetical protein